MPHPKPPPAWGPPALLQRLYGADTVYSLNDLVLHLSQASTEAHLLKSALIQPFDHTDYTQNLLAGTFCVINHPGAPPLQDGFSLRQRSDQLELLHRAIEALLQTNSGKANVLCYGYRKRRPSTTGRQLHGTASTEAYCQNSIADSLLEPPWQLLLSRIGDTLMLYLLLHVSMFRKLPNECCLQISGPPISNVARAWRRAATTNPEMRDIKAPSPRKRKAEGVPLEERASQDHDDSDEDLLRNVAFIATQEDCIVASDDPVAVPSGGAAANPQEVQQAQQAQQQQQCIARGEREASNPLPARKKARPSSWQRKKAYAAQQAMQIDGSNNPDGISGPSSIPTTQPLDSPSLQPSGEHLQQQGDSARTKATSLPYGYSQWPRYMPKFTEMAIVRSTIFYCATFPPRPGLPSKHILNAIARRKDADRVLYTSIFDPKQNPVGRLSNAHKPFFLMVPQPAKRVPASRRHILPLLSSLVHRTSKCPFAILLNLYCPLPREMRAGQIQQAPVEGVTVQTDDQSLDGMLDELHQLEATAQRKQKKLQHVGAGIGGLGGVGAGTSAALHSQDKGGGSGSLQRRGRKFTGLSQLIHEAESQLDPLLAVGIPQGGGGAGGGGGGGASRKDGASTAEPVVASSVELPGAAALPATQPLDDSTFLDGAVPMDAEGNGTAAGLEGQEGDTGAQPGGATPFSPDSLATCFVPHAQVTAFVWSTVRRIVPAALLGAKPAQRALQRSIRRFVSLRRYEQMSVHQIMQGMRIKDFTWIASPASQGRTVPPSEASAQQRTLALWLGWLFSTIVVPILRAHFFCTESEAYRQQVFYYRKPVWSRLAESAVTGLANGQFAPLPSGRAEQILKSRKLGVAKLRLLPKRVGMRFIVNLGRKSVVTFKGDKKPVHAGIKHPRRTQTSFTFASVNSVLQNVHQVLKYEASRQPGAFGASVFGYNDAYCRLQPFIRKWKATAAAAAASSKAAATAGATATASGHGGTGTFNGGDPPKLATGATTGATASAPAAAPLRPYIVSVDVSRAFDHVDVSTLLDLVAQLLQSDHYLVLKYSEIVPSLGDVKVIPRRLAIPADAPEAASDFPARAAQWAAVQKSKIYVDGVVYERMSRADALTLMRQHLTANLVRMRRQWHYQCRGIAQGSTLSTLLCCLYLAHVEKVCLNPLITAALPAPSFLAATPGGTTTSAGRLTALAAAAGQGSPASFAARRPAPTASGASRSLLPNGSVMVPGGTPSTAQPQPQPLPSHSVLMRLVDDWILVTHHLDIAANVAACLLSGIPSFNVIVNPDKTKLSFRLRLEGGEGGGQEVSPSLFITDDGARFIKWCGLLVNADSLEIQGDYTRYAGEHVSTALTLPLRKSPGAALGQKLCHYLRPKVHPLLLDPAINSQRTVRLNVYQAYMLGAMKFHCYVNALPAAPAGGSTVLMDAIEMGIRFMCQLTRPRRVASLHRAWATVACATQLSPAHVRFLGLYAFRTVLGRKQALYRDLLKVLDEALAAPCCARCAKALADVVDPRRSTIFEAVMY